MHLHTEIYPNLKSISELFKMYLKSLDRFFYISITRQLSRVQPDTRLSPPLRRQSSFSSAASHQCLWDIAAAWLAVIFFSRYNRFAETHSHLQLSYHITDRLLAAGNYLTMFCVRFKLSEWFLRFEDFLSVQGIFASIGPWRRVWFFNSMKLHFHHPSMLRARV